MTKLINILYIEPLRCFFYGQGVPNETAQLDFPPDIARDAEIESKEKLIALFTAFLQTNNIEPSTTTIVLSPLFTFEKELSGMNIAQQRTESLKFLDSVPFENVVSQTAPFGQKRFIIAANKDFIDVFRSILTQYGCIVPSVIPASILQQMVPELQTNLDLKLLFDKTDMARQYNFLTPQEQPKIIETFTGKPQNKIRVIALIVSFTILLVILGYMIFTNVLPHK